MRKIIVEIQVEWDGYDDVCDELVVEDALSIKKDGITWRVVKQVCDKCLKENTPELTKAMLKSK